jgi:hypothetical protein
MIYFIQAELVGRIKIGLTSKAKINDRLSNLQSSSPVMLHLLATTRGGREKEQRLHARFAYARVVGEWFDPVPKLVRLIARIQGRQVRDTREPAKKLLRRERAADWLRSRFREQIEWSTKELITKAANDGISRPAIFEGKKMLGNLTVQARGCGGTRAYFWRSGPAHGPLGSVGSVELFQAENPPDSTDPAAGQLNQSGQLSDATN